MKLVCWRSALLVVAISSFLFAQSSPGATDLPPCYWPLAKSQVMVDKTRPVQLAPDLSQLGAVERLISQIKHYAPSLDQAGKHCPKLRKGIAEQ